MSALQRALGVIGPGIVFAGAAIGVSHLVQATRAGAGYGLSLLLLVLFIHALKYPALSFAPRYVAATGHSLLHAYRLQGRWALIMFGLVQTGTMFTIVAAVSMVTAAVFGLVVIEPVFSVTPDVGWVTAGVLAACVGLLQFGGYRWLERSVKWLIGLLGVCTLVAAALVLPRVASAVLEDPGGVRWVPELSSVAVLAFVVPLAGWMPAPLDISVWNSLWSVEQVRSRGVRCSRSEARLDFNAGYLLCAVLAVCFLIMGAGLIYFEGLDPAEGGVGLVAQTLSLYTSTLGGWAGPVVGVAAIAVMFSTTLTVMDALPRTMSALVRTLRGSSSELSAEKSRVGYRVWLIVLALGGLAIVLLLRGQLGRMVDLATTLSFVSTPVLAWLNHRAMFSAEVDPDHRPGRVTRIASWIAIAAFSIAAVAYVPWYFLVGPGA